MPNVGKYIRYMEHLGIQYFLPYPKGDPVWRAHIFFEIKV